MNRVRALKVLTALLIFLASSLWSVAADTNGAPPWSARDTSFAPVFDDSVNTFLQEPDGSRDGTFKADPTNATSLVRLLVQPDNRLLLLRGDSPAIIRCLPHGERDPSFPPVTFESWESPFGLYSAGLDSAGRLVIGGNFNAVSGVPQSNLVRLMPNGAVDATFQPEVASVENLAITSDDGMVLTTRSQGTPGPAPMNDTLTILRLDVEGHPSPQFQVRAQVFNAFRGNTSFSLARLDDNCMIVGVAQCGMGGCWTTAGQLNASGGWEVEHNSADAPFAVGGYGGLWLLKAVSTNTWYASTIRQLIRFTVVRDWPAGAAFEDPAAWVPQGNTALLPVTRGGSTNGTLTLHYRITAGNASPDYVPVTGTVSFEPGKRSLMLPVTSPAISGSASENLLVATLESAEGGILYGLTQATVHFVIDARAAKAPRLEVRPLPSSGRIAIDLWDFPPGTYEVQAGNNLRDFTTWQYVYAFTPRLPLAETLEDEIPAASSSRFYRVVRAP